MADEFAFVVSRSVDSLAGEAARGRPTVAPKMRIETTDGKTSLVVPFAPGDVSHDNLGINWSQVSRPGRFPLLEYQDKKLHTMSFDLMLVHGNNLYDVEDYLHTLYVLKETRKHLKVRYGYYESWGTWRLTNMSYTASMRQKETNKPLQAMVSLEFTRTNDFDVHVGPVTKGAKKHKAGASGGVSHPSGGKPKTGSGKKRYYTVKRGDTLSGIAYKMYHNVDRWRRIADANHIKDPRKLAVGKRLVIP